MYTNLTTKNIVLTPKDKVVSMKVSAVVKNCTGVVNITDIMLQTGDTNLNYNGHPSEIKWVGNN